MANFLYAADRCRLVAHLAVTSPCPSEQRVGMFGQALEPAEFVIELRAGHWIAVGTVKGNPVSALRERSLASSAIRADFVVSCFCHACQDYLGTFVKPCEFCPDEAPTIRGLNHV